MTTSRWRSRIPVATLLLATPLLAAACAQGPNLPQGPQAFTASAPRGKVGAVVTLLYASFEPSVVRITQGETVEFLWKDRPNPHDVYISDYVTPSGVKEAVESPLMVNGTWYEVFDVPGTYHYLCTIHPNMQGTVIVAASSGGSGPSGGGSSGGGTGTTIAGITGAGTTGLTGSPSTGVSGAGTTGTTG